MADFQEMCSTEVCASQNHEPTWKQNNDLFILIKKIVMSYKLCIPKINNSIALVGRGPKRDHWAEKWLLSK